MASYIINTVLYENPVYGAFGEGKTVDYDTESTPYSFRPLSAGMRFIYTVFSRVGSTEPSIKLPFTYTEDEFVTTRTYDMRIGG